ncbi:YihY/virulence factor BrkB family protein [Cryobacterium sp. TMT1-2-2]|uniref:YihY/virulence factor BrkB family protein n=1 Tax=Cryobacterium sp. TMT1-2-2 TaxID=1259233 RepID=UPI001069F7CA|nr:YihY/virulence factor BrkB family protein [Cryobacterium sp. TMT1-2-2]TFD10084.1 YihY/virulence factor BrkB family protein [Cryobacterium sp. TMT1-2-2]
MVDEGQSQDLADAPAPDDDRKPDSPTEVTKTSWKYVAKRTLSEFGTDQCTDIAATLTYYAVLSLFPALIALVSLLGVFGQGKQSADTLLTILASIAPSDALDVIRGPIEQFSTSPSAGFALVAGIAVAIWSASGYVGAFSRAMNRIYEIDEGRTFLKLKPTQLLVTVIGIALLLVVVLILAISGPVTDAVGAALGLGQTVQVVWSIAKWPVLAATVVLLIAVLYYFTPNVRQPKFRWLSLGALVALVAIVVASLGFGFYVTTFSNYAKTYGSLAGIVIFLLWLWLTNLALLFGAEFDAELERGRQLQAGIAAEQNIQLPPRGTKKSQKAALKEMQTVADGRRIRKANAAPRE